MQGPAQHETYKILFVDDEENVLRSLKRLFVDHDVEVFTASSGKEGLELLKENEIAVIVSDQRMPEMSGAEFLELARKLAPDSVRMVLTGYADINAAMDAINKGGTYRYITKPWNDNEFLLAIRDAVEKYRLVKENRYLTELTAKQNEELKKWSAELETYVQQQTIDLTKQNKELKKLNEKLGRNLKDVISAFSNLIELRGEIFHSHSNNVAVISGKLARKIGLNDSEIDTIAIAAQLHDIGKIGVSDAVMLKTAQAMSPKELEEYQKHPIRGQVAIDFIEDLREAGVLIRHHHEWFNGKGFPDGLKENGIPIGARIIALADGFDRLRHGLFEIHPAQSVLTRLRTQLGTQFDPGLFTPFAEIIKDGFSTDPHAANSIEIDASSAVEIETTLKELIPGMIVSRDIRSGTGILLVSMGTVLDEKKIAALQRNYHIDPSKGGIFVWIKKKQARR